MQVSGRNPTWILHWAKPSEGEWGIAASPLTEGWGFSESAIQDPYPGLQEIDVFGESEYKIVATIPEEYTWFFQDIYILQDTNNSFGEASVALCNLLAVLHERLFPGLFNDIMDFVLEGAARVPRPN